jgi:ribose transport system ATP-binding protein
MSGRHGSTAAAVSIQNVSKRFGATQALDGVGFEVMPGEIHALCGGNGSGKSTLIKILTGVHHADPGGMVRVGEQTVDAASITSRRARELGIRALHQDLGTFGDMSVSENMALGRGFDSGFGMRIRWRAVEEYTNNLLSRYEIPASAKQRMDVLSHAVQAQVAIARSLQDVANGAQAFLILDEPTTALPEHEVQVLFAALRRFAAAGNSILFVSHRLDEVRDIADTVTILRDGRRSGTWRLDDLTDDGLIELIVGRPLESAFPSAKEHTLTAEPILEVTGLKVGPLAKVNLAVRGGEILGIAGLVGSGRTEILRAIHGSLRIDAGIVCLSGQDVTRLSTTARRGRGVALIPEDRVKQAVFTGMSVLENLTAASLRHYRRWFSIDRAGIQDATQRLVQRFSIKVGNVRQPIETLSGGNQQKVILARWMKHRPRILLLDEPTQGVDIGARTDIYRHIRAAVDDGAAAILVASDFEELAHIADRVVILQNGRVGAELSGAELTPPSIAARMYSSRGSGPMSPDTASVSGPAHSHPRTVSERVTGALERLGLPVLFLALILLFSLAPASQHYFLSGPNIRQLLANQAVTAVVALGMIAPLVAGYFDLSVPAVAGISSVVFAHTVGPLGLPIWASMITALAISLIAGCITGFLVAVVRLNGLIVTLGSYTLIQGLLEWFTGGQTISNGIPTSLGQWSQSSVIGLPSPFLATIALALIMWYVLMHVPAGRELESIGSNEMAARLVGIRVTRNVYAAFLASAFIAGLAGLLLTMQAGSADPTSAPAYLFPALAAVFLGATCLRPGKYNVWGTILGVYFLAVAVNGFTFLGASAWITPVFNGAALVIAVLLSTLMGRRSEQLGRPGARHKLAEKKMTEETEEAEDFNGVTATTAEDGSS